MTLLMAENGTPSNTKKECSCVWMQRQKNFQLSKSRFIYFCWWNDMNTTQLGAVLSIRVASCYGQSHYVLFALAQNLRVMPKYKWVYNQRLMKRRPTVANQPSAASQPPFFSLSSPLHRDYKSNAQWADLCLYKANQLAETRQKEKQLEYSLQCASK